jgi:U4/U6 small nuclear ribonucleoprotein PRP31
MPSCNMQMLGTRRKHLNGLSLASMNMGAGFLFGAELTQKSPPDLKKKCVKLLAAKAALAARVDSCHEDPSGSIGQRFHDEVKKRLDKLQEPPPVKKTKALPAPDDKPRKKRGGKRIRKLKEKMAQTDLAKQANRMAFGQAEEEVHMGGDTMKGLGMVGQNQQSGKLRISAKEQKIKLSKQAMQRRGLTAASSGATGGISSSIVMSSNTGMIFEEMRTDGSGTVTPARLMPTKAENLKYFGTTSKDGWKK